MGRKVHNGKARQRKNCRGCGAPSGFAKWCEACKPTGRSATQGRPQAGSAAQVAMSARVAAKNRGRV